MAKHMEKTSELVQTLFNQWVKQLNMAHMGPRLVIIESTRADDENTAADTDAKWQYRDAKIRAYLGALHGMTDEHIENVIVHELVHVLVNPMESYLTDKHTDRCELAVQNVTEALLALHRQK